MTLEAIAINPSLTLILSDTSQALFSEDSQWFALHRDQQTEIFTLPGLDLIYTISAQLDAISADLAYGAMITSKDQIRVVTLPDNETLTSINVMDNERDSDYTGFTIHSVRFNGESIRYTGKATHKWDDADDRYDRMRQDRAVATGSVRFIGEGSVPTFSPSPHPRPFLLDAKVPDVLRIKLGSDVLEVREGRRDVDGWYVSSPDGRYLAVQIRA